jgi:predicted RNA-binding Zn-ribbon protein involved in translation (DUF1610 family)
MSGTASDFDCPTCGRPLAVVRTVRRPSAIRRRRRCKSCGFTLSTLERPAAAAEALLLPLERISVADVLRTARLLCHTPEPTATLQPGDSHGPDASHAR